MLNHRFKVGERVRVHHHPEYGDWGIADRRVFETEQVIVALDAVVREPAYRLAGPSCWYALESMLEPAHISPLETSIRDYIRTELCTR